MDDETLEIKAAHRPNAPVTKPEVVTYEYSRQVVKPLRWSKYKARAAFLQIFLVFFGEKNF